MLLEVILGVNMGYCVPHCAGLYYGEQGRGRGAFTSICQNLVPLGTCARCGKKTSDAPPKLFNYQLLPPLD